MQKPKEITMQDKHPELSTPRTVPMQVMNLGFPRTGTISIQVALNILGYNCYHSSLFFKNDRDCSKWNSAMDAKYRSRGPRYTRREWDQLLGSYSAVSADAPAVAFAEDLISAYPEALVILVERKMESWYRSFDTNIITAAWNFVAALDPWHLGPVRRCHRRWVTGWMDSHCRGEMREKARQTYRDHYALVRRVTPKGRLLEFKLEDGWESLCKFLGKPVPEVPFPHANDSKALQELLAVAMRRGGTMLSNAL